MNDATFPCFLDIEASSFGERSWPVAVAWSDPAGAITRLLVNPSGVAGWDDWEPAAEAVHGLSREHLERNGWPPDYVAERLENDLAGRTVYTDAPDYDGRWLATLFSTLDREVPVQLEHVDEALLTQLRRRDEAVWQVLVRIESLKDEIAGVRVGRHDAGFDVGWLLALWRRALGEPVKMLHGVGPLPARTLSGSFVRPASLRDSER
jgi:hypothetical protein